MRQNFFKGLVETVLVTYVSASMFIYGTFKYAQFRLGSYAEQVVGDLTNMELMWAFYSRTLTFPLILGFFEILGAGLFFFRKTRLFGGFLLSTILINIIIQDIIYNVLAGAIVSAAIYQLIILHIMWKNRGRIGDALKSITLLSEPNKVKWVIHVVIGLAVALVIKMTMGL